MASTGIRVERLTTPRLVLEPLTVEHADEMAVVLADRALYTVIGGTPPTPSGLRERYRRLAVGHSADGSEQWFNWIVRLRGADGSVGPCVGTVQATVLSGDARSDVAWIIGVPWQGRGLGSEAASAMVEWLGHRGVSTITAHIHPDHPASQAVARRAGLTATDHYVDGEQRWLRGGADTQG